MSAPVEDPLLLGQRVVAILETGLRTATYKLATLMAIIDYAIEHFPNDPEASLPVPIPDLAHRVIESYWQQVRPFEGEELRQSSQPVARIPRAVLGLREACGVGNSSTPLAAAILRNEAAYRSALDEVTVTLAQQPLPRLQRLPNDPSSVPFLYDDNHLHSGLSRRALRNLGEAIELKPGVAHALARLGGLLKPTLEIMWVEDVRRMNRFLDERVPDVAGHLFGRERVSLAAVRDPLKEAFGPRCFYCETLLPRDNPIDHVLPWALLGIDGLANLVPACKRCNEDKRHSLPATDIVDRTLQRDREALEAIALQLRWPTQYDRVVAAARGLYRNQPAGAPTWSGYRTTTALDVARPSWWLRLERGL